MNVFWVYRPFKTIQNNTLCESTCSFVSVHLSSLESNSSISKLLKCISQYTNSYKGVPIFLPISMPLFGCRFVGGRSRFTRYTIGSKSFQFWLKEWEKWPFYLVLSSINFSLFWNFALNFGICGRLTCLNERE